MSQILHVEDDPDWRRIMKYRLEQLGYEVVSCASLTEAREGFAQGEFVLVVCDGDIHGKGDGINWARELQSQGQKVIVVSGYPPEDMPSMNKNNIEGLGTLIQSVVQ